MGKTHVLLANGKVFRANFDPLASMNAEEPDKTTTKPQNRNRNKENRRQIRMRATTETYFRKKSIMAMYIE